MTRRSAVARGGQPLMWAPLAPGPLRGWSLPHPALTLTPPPGVDMAYHCNWCMLCYAERGVACYALLWYIVSSCSCCVVCSCNCCVVCSCTLQWVPAMLWHATLRGALSRAASGGNPGDWQRCPLRSANINKLMSHCAAQASACLWGAQRQEQQEPWTRVLTSHTCPGLNFVPPPRVGSCGGKSQLHSGKPGAPMWCTIQ